METFLGEKIEMKKEELEVERKNKEHQIAIILANGLSIKNAKMEKMIEQLENTRFQLVEEKKIETEDKN
ncbi:conserved hypothetical protein [Ricinus communis]|uniref:Uncharacterized protein n=1 Tax=Ricinus communis TaxID=3988 RepID=B9SII8_RICCO|nr:conserved hypothetical protein [Ricinus communis]